VLIHRLTAPVVVLLWLFSLIPTSVHAQYAEGLPPGILSVEVDGQPIDTVTIPMTNNPTPEISGRVELGDPTIDLAVADGEVIRFSAELDDRGRFRAPVPQPLPDGQYALYINDVLIGVFEVQSGAADEQREPGPLLDIARVVPYPADFGDLTSGIGFLDGRFYTLEEEAARTAATANGDVRETQRRLAEAGWLQRYENRLAVPNADNPDIFDVQISSFVIEYASGADARSAFVVLVGDETPVDAPTVGDESSLTLLTGTTPDTGAEYQAARLVFRVGPMLGMIVYADLRNEAPDLGLLDSVSQAVAERATVVADRQSVPLGAMTLRLDPTGAAQGLVRRDLYDVRAGALTALFSEDDATRESRVALYTGTTDAFSSTTNGTFSQDGSGQRAATAAAAEPTEPMPTSVISVEGQAPGPDTSATPAPSDETATEAATAQVFMVSALYAFPGDAEAESWFAQQRERILSQESGATIFTEVTDAPTLGDASATFATQRPVGTDEQTAGGFRIYSRVGAIVAVVDIGSVPDMPLNGAARIMEMQVACIQEQGCTGPATLPARLFGGTDEAVTEETEAGGEQAAEPTPASVIVVEGDESAPAATNEPKPTREPRERRNRDKDEDSGA
jgi:hypothetical protein